MPINPALALQVKGLELPDPMAQMAQVTQIQNALQQQRMGDIQMQNALREQSRQRELESIMSQLSPTAPVSEQAAALHRRGYFQQAQALTQQAATLAKTRREEEDARLKALTSKLDLTGRFFSEDVKNQATYDVARERAIAAGLGTAAEIPEVFDPAIVARVRNNAMSIKDQLAARQREREVGARETSAQAAASQAQTAAQRAQRDRVPVSVQEFDAFNRMTPEQQAVFTAFRAIKRPQTNIQMPPGESAFDKQVGDILGKEAGQEVVAARNAPNVAARANSVLAAVEANKAFMGPAADFKLQLARALNVTGKGPSEQIAATETLIADLKQSVIEAIKASNLGTGNGFTNKDLQFLVDAKAADIAKDPRTLQEFAERAYKTAEEAARKGNARMAGNAQIKKQAGVEKFEVPDMVTVSRRSSVRRGAAPDAAPNATAIPKSYTGAPALWQYMSPEDRALWKD